MYSNQYNTVKYDKYALKAKGNHVQCKLLSTMWINTINSPAIPGEQISVTL